jgi:hypothetical protein
MAKRKMPDEVRRFFAEAGRKGGKIGGKSTSKAKVGAARRNIAAARARWRSDLMGGRHAD